MLTKNFLKNTFIFSLILSLSSCTQKQNTPRLLAKEPDISVPLGFHLTSQQTPTVKPKVSNFSCYKGHMSVTNVINYYMHEMERTGWEIKNLSSTHKGVLVCTKINKSCVIFITRDELRTQIEIFTKKD
jgi:hypothetical protein